MWRSLTKSIFLLISLVVIVCVIYPSVLWIIGQTLFPFQANGSLLYDEAHKAVGSVLIAQAFTDDGYFQPRPSAANYDATASASSALAVSNYALRDRVARTLGPIVRYADGRLVAPDIETWFKQNRFQGKPAIVAQWARAHPTLATAWVNADPANQAYVTKWQKTHPAMLAKYKRQNPYASAPQPADLGVLFFQSLSLQNPGKFPVLVSRPAANGKVRKMVELQRSGADIQATFFDMWRQDHPGVVLQMVPGDLVTASASGLDPDISLQNAKFQLDRVATTWAARLHRDPKSMRNEIGQIIQQQSWAPWGGLLGERLVNVLGINLELKRRYMSKSNE
jgi:K+-transporting ATPase ATPase C chain